MDTAQFKNHFLLAMPSGPGGGFADSVVFMAEHNAEGAMGLVINKPGDLTVADLLSQLEIEAHVARRIPVYWGGPVETERGFVLHRDEGDWDSTLHLADGMAITASRDILEAIGNGFGPSSYLIMLGYAGWAGSQLEQEILANSWLTMPADQSIIFDSPAERRWSDAASLLGVSAHQLSGLSGRA